MRCLKSKESLQLVRLQQSICPKMISDQGMVQAPPQPWWKRYSALLSVKGIKEKAGKYIIRGRTGNVAIF